MSAINLEYVRILFFTLLNSVLSIKIQEEKIEGLAKDKNKKNKNAIQETQLVKIDKYLAKEDTINIKKIE